MFKKVLIAALLLSTQTVSAYTPGIYTDRAAFNQAIKNAHYVSTETFDVDGQPLSYGTFVPLSASGIGYYNPDQIGPAGTIANGVFSDTVRHENMFWNWPSFGQSGFARDPIWAAGGDFKLSPTGSGLSIHVFSYMGGGHILDLPAGYEGFAGYVGGAFMGMGLVAENQQITLDNLTVVASIPFNTVNPVPEPETYALMLTGLGLVGMATKRKRSV